MNVSVLGCGWLGLPLAAELVARGHSVRGSVRRAEKLGALAAAGIRGHRLELSPAPEGDGEGFFDADTLVITLPPKRSEAGANTRYPAQIAVLLAATPAGTRLVFTGSTSVYPELNRTVTEADAGNIDDTTDRAAGDTSISDSGRGILAAEELLRARGGTILRLAGLYGYDRQPGRRLSGRPSTGGETPVNLVHCDDVLRVLVRVIEERLEDTTLNVCADLHPTRRAVYTRQAERFGFAPPRFVPPHEKTFKRVDNDKLKKTLGFSLTYADPLEDAP